MRSALLVVLALIVVRPIVLEAQQRRSLGQLVRRGSEVEINSSDLPPELSDPVQYLHPANFALYTGPVLGLHDNSRAVRVWGTLKNGRWDGLREDYYANGQLKSRGNYKNGKWDGPFERYYDNGQLIEKGTLKDGALVGPHEYFWPSGRVKVRGNYADGPLEDYYANGQLKSRRNYKDGKWDGPFERYYDNGQLMEKGTLKYDGIWWWKSGHLDGPYEEYWPDGRARVRGTWKDGEQCGEWLEEGETVTYPPCSSDQGSLTPMHVG